MKAGTQRGNGNLYVKDVEWIDQTRPIASFNFHVASPAQLEALGIIEGSRLPNAPQAPRPTTSALMASNQFLRTSNRILLSLLTPEQKIAFLEQMEKDPRVSKSKSVEAVREKKRRIEASISSNPVPVNFPAQPSTSRPSSSRAPEQSKSDERSSSEKDADKGKMQLRSSHSSRPSLLRPVPSPTTHSPVKRSSSSTASSPHKQSRAEADKEN
ncbi:hypothetical protein T439DRAFT_16878 [Meredithblackwellia eburnea MCA 4105]